MARKTAIQKAIDELANSHHQALIGTMDKLGYPIDGDSPTSDEPTEFWPNEKKIAFDALTQYKDTLDEIIKEKYSSITK